VEAGGSQVKDSRRGRSVPRRHTCDPLLVIKGVRPKYVQELLGHANISITADTYSHVIPGMGNQTVDAMKEIFT
jgi:site-specific recombinase XerD